MGQGTESCGGYDLDYDEYDDDSLIDGMWTQKNGTRISVTKMSTSHLESTSRMCERLARSATFTSERDKWEQWVDIFDTELSRRVKEAKPKKEKVGVAKPSRGAKQWMVCHCGKHYQARLADLKRGWGLSCGKSCAATRREFGRPAAKPRDEG